ncbi:MAG: histidine phosphatase family protein [Solirubrobacteraceae bacterium]|jgi:broad specificity phosphatase PhoE
MRRLVLVRHASTTAVRRSAFPLDEPLDAAGRAAASTLAGRLGRGDALTSPALRARTTAEAAGLDARTVGAICECDFGAWAGRTLAEVWDEEPVAAQAWMTDPAAAPHGGESLAAFLGRIGTWLDEQAQLDGRAVAVTHGGVVKAAVIHALAAGPEAFWRVDAAPLHATELHGREGRWSLARVNAPIDGASSARSEAV